MSAEPIYVGCMEPSACWSDPTGHPGHRYGCAFKGTGRLGLCPVHEAEILGPPADSDA